MSLANKMVVLHTYAVSLPEGTFTDWMSGNTPYLGIDLAKHDYLSRHSSRHGMNRAYSRGLHHLGSIANQLLNLLTFSVYETSIVVRCSDSSLLSAITIEHGFQTNRNGSPKATYHPISSLTTLDSHATFLLSQSRTNGRSIATQRIIAIYPALSE